MRERKQDHPMEKILPYLFMIAAFVLLFLLSSCGPKSPLQEMADAQAALKSARERGAETSHGEEYGKAEALLDQALQKMRDKKYEEARSLAIEAKSWLDRIPPVSPRPETQNEVEKSPAPEPDFETVLLTSNNLGKPDSELALPRVYFDFNDFALRDDARDSLKRAAAWMLNHPAVSLDVQGHCDERGTNEYNLALGERRAVAVRQYWEALGIDPNRLRVISFGEELPLKEGEGEDVWRWNRRVQFVLSSIESPAADLDPARHPGGGAVNPFP